MSCILASLAAVAYSADQAQRTKTDHGQGLFDISGILYSGIDLVQRRPDKNKVVKAKTDQSNADDHQCNFQGVLHT